MLRMARRPARTGAWSAHRDRRQLRRAGGRDARTGAAVASCPRLGGDPPGRATSGRARRAGCGGQRRQRRGAGRVALRCRSGRASLLYVTISTGIGGGWVIGGRIWGGADGMAGEIGHMIVRPGGAPCACGGAVARRLRQAGGRSRRRRGNDWKLGTGSWKLEAGLAAPWVRKRLHISDAGQRQSGCHHGAACGPGGRGRRRVGPGSPGRRGPRVGAALGAAISLMNPERVVLGGGVTKVGRALVAHGAR